MQPERQPIHILLLLPELPFPPCNGGRWKVFNLIQILTQKGHRCDILCFGEPASPHLRAYEALMPGVRVLDVVVYPTGIRRWAGILWGLLRGEPYSMGAISSPVFARTVKAALKNSDYDVVHLDIINMAQYLPLASTKPTVHSPNDATSLSYMRMIPQESSWRRKFYLKIGRVFLRRYERIIYPRFNKVHVVSPVDGEYLRNLNSKIDVEIVPIAVDPSYLDAGQDRSVQCTQRIIISGNLENPGIAAGLEEFLRHAYPSLLRAHPDIELVILHQHATPGLTRRLRSLPHVTFVEWVDDYVNFINTADIVLALDKAGTGIKNRVIQAMALGLPVVGSQVAYEGIPVTNGDDGFVFTTIDECVQLISQLLADGDLRRNAGQRARALVKREYTLSVLSARYEALYFGAIAKFHTHEVRQTRSIIDNSPEEVPHVEARKP